MYLVKSCSTEFNSYRCGTIKIGTLQEYIETEQEQIADKFEGTFLTKLNLTNIEVDPEIVRILTSNHTGSSSCQNPSFEISSSSSDHSKTIFKTVKGIIHHWSVNRFIFCMSFLDDPRKANDILKDYDDYWFTDAENRYQFGTFIMTELRKEIIKQESLGNKIFEGNYDPKELDTLLSYMPVYYRERINDVTAENFHQLKDELCNCVIGATYIKPLSFSPEKEFRFMFDFIYKGRLLTPIVKNLYIPTIWPIKLMLEVK